MLTVHFILSLLLLLMQRMTLTIAFGGSSVALSTRTQKPVIQSVCIQSIHN